MSNSVSEDKKSERPIRLGIAGAGPAGLCIAGILVREAPGKFEIEVFERDSRERDQGSGWDVDAHGRTTLRRAGLEPATISRPGPTSFRCYTTFNKEPFCVVGLPAPFHRLREGDPETNRHAMREGLLASIGSKAKVNFRCGVYDLKPTGNGVTLHGENGDVLGEYDIVIDSSGVGSSLRKFRIPGTNLKEWYTGITTLAGTIQDAEAELDPEIVRRLGQGTLAILGDRHDGNGAFTLWYQRFGAQADDHRTSFGLYMPRKGITDLCEELGVASSTRATSETDKKETVEKIKAWIKTEMGDRWDPMYLQSVDCLTDINIRPLFLFNHNVLPIASSDLPFICVGDALHALPPFTGSGGNLALADSSELATFLVNYAHGQGKMSLIPSLRAIELKCIKRAAEVAKEGEGTRDGIIRTLNQKDISATYSLKVLIRGQGWTLLKRVLYVIATIYMWIHKLSDYGMAPLGSKAKAKSE